MSSEAVVPSWVIGVMASLVGSTLLNLGMNVQKYSHMKNLALPDSQQVPEYKQTLWVVGFVMFVVGNLGDLVALGFAAQSLIAPLGSVSLLSNAIIAPIFLGERFTIKDAVATVFIVAGATLTVVFGAKEETQYTLAELLALYSNVGFIIYAVFVAVIVIGLYAGVRVARVRLAELGGVHTQDPLGQRWRVFLPFGFAALGGIIGSQTVLTAKSAAELVKVSLQGDNQFVYPFTYVIILVVAVTAITQVHWINEGLKHFDALYIIPVFFVVWTLFSILGGNLYFDEFKSFDELQSGMFALGVILTCVGVFLLSDRNEEANASLSSGQDEIELMEREAVEAERANATKKRANSLGSQLRIDLDKPLSPREQHQQDKESGVTGTVVAAAQSAGGRLRALSAGARKHKKPQDGSASGMTVTVGKHGAADDDHHARTPKSDSSEVGILDPEEDDAVDVRQGQQAVRAARRQVSVVNTKNETKKRTGSVDAEPVLHKYAPGFHFDEDEAPQFFRRKTPVHTAHRALSPITPTPDELVPCKQDEAEYFTVVEKRTQTFPPISPEKGRNNNNNNNNNNNEEGHSNSNRHNHDHHEDAQQEDGGQEAQESELETEEQARRRSRASTLDELMQPAKPLSNSMDAVDPELGDITNVDSPSLPGKLITDRHNTPEPTRNNNTQSNDVSSSTAAVFSSPPPLGSLAQPLGDNGEESSEA